MGNLYSPPRTDFSNVLSVDMSHELPSESIIRFVLHSLVVKIGLRLAKRFGDFGHATSLMLRLRGVDNVGIREEGWTT
jgi:hypothetical protein